MMHFAGLTSHDPRELLFIFNDQRNVRLSDPALALQSMVGFETP